MTITAFELATKLKFNPRVSILTGTLEEQRKVEGSLSGFTPHYVLDKCPAISFNEAGDPMAIKTGGAEVEVKLKETDTTFRRILGRRNSSTTVVQLMFADKSNNATEAECRVLREAGRIWALLANTRREVYVAAIGILIPAGGWSRGVFHPMGIFSTDGETLWLNPEAIQTGAISNALFHPDQKTLTLTDEAVAAAPAPTIDSSWYDSVRTALEDALNIKGKKLHDAVIASRAKTLVKEGTAASIAEGTKLAQEAYDSFSGAAPSAPAAAKPAAAPAPARRGGFTAAKTK